MEVMVRTSLLRCSGRRAGRSGGLTEPPHHQKGKSDHVVTLHQAFESPESVSLVLELCSGGELFDRVRTRPNVLIIVEAID